MTPRVKSVISFIEKPCSKCGNVKPLSEFNKRTRSYDSLTSACRECLKAINKPYRIINAEKARENTRLWKSANPEWAKIQNREWYIKNRDKAKETSRIWRAKNRGKHIENVLNWKKANPEKVKEYDRKKSLRIRSTPAGKLNGSITAQIYNSIRGLKGGRTWESLVGYTLETLMVHLEKQFKPGMTWTNYGRYWHLDHKIPKSAFNYRTPENIDFKRCWALKNLQPLEATKNIKKGAKLDKPFQPSLAL